MREDILFMDTLLVLRCLVCILVILNCALFDYLTLIRIDSVSNSTNLAVRDSDYV